MLPLILTALSALRAAEYRSNPKRAHFVGKRAEGEGRRRGQGRVGAGATRLGVEATLAQRREL